jgi:hypothetical protein
MTNLHVHMQFESLYMHPKLDSRNWKFLFFVSSRGITVKKKLTDHNQIRTRPAHSYVEPSHAIWALYIHPNKSSRAETEIFSRGITLSKKSSDHDKFDFYVTLKNISLMWRRHHYRWRAAKFRSMLGAQGLWVRRDLYRATPAVTRDLGFSGFIQRTAPFSVASYDTQGDVEDLF